MNNYYVQNVQVVRDDRNVQIVNLNKAEPIEHLDQAQRSNNSSGFGILEVVVATGILVIVISASVILAKMAVKSSVLSLERVQAYNLAQQGIEMVRAIRDTNWIDGDSNTVWNDKLTTGDHGANINNWQLTIDPSDTSSLDNREFRRVINISSIDSAMAQILSQFDPDITSDKMLKIKVSVSWKEYGQDWDTELITYLSDWKPGL